MFEKGPKPEKEESEITAENKKFQEIHDRFEKKVKYATIAGLVGVSAYAGLDEYIEHKAIEKHETHIGMILDADEYQRYLGLREVMADIYGESVVEQIIKGDMAALEARELGDVSRPDFRGFDRVNHLGENGSISHYPNFVFTESFGMYPQGWLSGEISSVAIEDGKDARVTGDNVQGATFHRSDDFVVIYDISDTFSAEDFNLQAFDTFMQDSFAHESGHANDWETKIDLNALERFELLDAITQRMTSETAFSDRSLADGSDYWRSFDDGTQSGFDLMAREYWAEIVAAYFTNPQILQSEYPLDFALVQDIVEKTDTEFDILDPERGAYNTTTGQRNEKWSADFERLTIGSN